MGTSTRNKGQNGRTPLVPSWLDDSDNNDNNVNNELPPLADPDRFSIPRNNFTRYINSSGRNTGNLRRATSSYIGESLGGARNATMRLGSARMSTARLLSLFNSFSSLGLNETGIRYGLGELIGKSTKEVFIRIMDFVCSSGGSIDEGIARNSYIETMTLIPGIEDRRFESFDEAEFLAFTEIYMSNVIKERLLNDIGNKTITLPDDITTVEVIQTQIWDLISGSVSDAITELHMDVKNIDNTRTQQIVDNVYERAYSILASLEE